MKDWLREEFYKSNHPKYFKYFEEWFDAVTEDQMNGFEQQRIGQITKSKCA